MPHSSSTSCTPVKSTKKPTLHYKSLFFSIRLPQYPAEALNILPSPHTTNAAGSAALRKFMNQQRIAQENAFGESKADIDRQSELPRTWDQAAYLWRYSYSPGLCQAVKRGMAEPYSLTVYQLLHGKILTCRHSHLAQGEDFSCLGSGWHLMLQTWSKELLWHEISKCKVFSSVFSACLCLTSADLQIGRKDS